MPDIELRLLTKKSIMKFSDSLTFNAAPELQGHYLAYDALKDAIYRLERQQVMEGGHTDLESAALMSNYLSEHGHEEDSAARVFRALLDKEVKHISEFFQKEEASVLSQVESIVAEIDEVERADWADEEDADGSDAESIDSPVKRSSSHGRRSMQTHSHSRTRARALSSASNASAVHDLDDVDEVQKQRRLSVGSSTHSNSVWTSNTDWATDTRITFKLRLQGLFRELTQLKQYISLNHTGFRKILKKFDKTTENSLREAYMTQVVDKAYPFLPSTAANLNKAIQTVVDEYAKIVTRGNIDVAWKQLRTQLREFVVYERNTVWRNMVGLHAKGHLAAPERHRSLGVEGASLPLLVEGKEDASSTIKGFNWKRKEIIGGVVGITLFVLLLSVNFMDRPEEQNCLALLALASIFWAAEVIPLFVTSLAVPLLVVVLRVIRSQDEEDRRLSAPEATKYIFSTMFSPTIMLLIGGFTLAAALSKHNIDKMLATRVLVLAGTKPRTVLIAYMAVACFASMWISNVAAPVLCYGLIAPILRTLPPKTEFAKALIMGIALSSNIGGQSSPISSPQNLIALEYMHPQLGWIQWFSVAIPVSSLSVFLIWILLCWSYSWENDLRIKQITRFKETFTIKQYFVSAVVVLTILLWCFSHQIDSFFGDMGVIAILPIVAFYGTGCLRKNDFESYPWAIVFLAMGGISLGKGVLSSGLLDDIDTTIQRVVNGLDIWPILALSSVVCLTIATFISHTVASVLLVPVAAQIGAAMSDPHPRLLIMATALICSAGMGLPISGFPNMTAINLENDMGIPYLAGNDFLKNGIPASVLAGAVIITVGYLAMRLIGL